MLYPIFTAFKDRLNTPEAPAQGIDLPVEWYNVQYEGTMVNPQGFFVEFPEKMNFENASNQMRRSPVKIRLHYYSMVPQTQDGIADATTEEHEAIAKAAKDLLDGYTPANGSCSRLTFVGWQHWHRWKGWMVTFIEFEAKKTL
ncbi:hypothetical protein C8N47_11196 [Mangrovibacterium marinum]|uniref:Uncharacterized protein n=1 Tax=Mangrovibacterium marinum TaxID=1639118 RepID=A0A2T5C0E1_9BACT|nr:hypothetical protein [Mangrovibacterium marinum]PTN08056.1 hypothetical protein C8N47_11196 [Mangrovibacterium marinum]